MQGLELLDVMTNVRVEMPKPQRIGGRFQRLPSREVTVTVPVDREAINDLCSAYALDRFRSGYRGQGIHLEERDLGNGIIAFAVFRGREGHYASEVRAALATKGLSHPPSTLYGRVMQAFGRSVGNYKP